VIHPGEDTLRARAAAAVVRQRLEEQLKRRDAEPERCIKAHRLLSSVLGVTAIVESLPIELDGLEFDLQPDCWLVLLRPCRSVLEGRAIGDCAEQTAAPIRSLADLGEALEQGPDDCAWCGGIVRRLT